MDTGLKTLVIDNFFNDVEQIFNYSKTLEYTDGSSRYPGVRTESLHVIDKYLYESIVDKIFSHYYDFPVTQKQVEIFFQKIGPAHNRSDRGFIHTDNWLDTFVVYLSPDLDRTCGTQLLDPKDNKWVSKVRELNDLKEQLHNGVIDTPNATRLLYLRDSIEQSFELNVDIPWKRNRAAMWNGNTHHRAMRFPVDQERVTLIGFVHGINGVTKRSGI